MVFESDNSFPFMSSVKTKPAHWKLFVYLFDALAMLSRNTHIFADIFMCWPKIGRTSLYIINKRNNLGLKDEKIKSLSYKNSLICSIITQ